MICFVVVVVAAWPAVCQLAAPYLLPTACQLAAVCLATYQLAAAYLLPASLLRPTCYLPACCGVDSSLE